MSGLAGRRGGVGALEPNATLEARIEVAPDVQRLVVRLDAPVLGFAPGQYFSLGLPREGRLVQRPYSTATAPGRAERLEFLIRRVPQGELTPEIWRLPVGGRLRLGPPKGLFTLLPGDRRTHLFVASGTGLAPFISMLGSLSRRPEPPPAVVVHGVARADELAYRDELEGWSLGKPRVRYEPTVSRPAAPENAGWTGRTGRAEACLEAIVPELGDPHGIVAYLCGNPGMIVAAGSRLLGSGLPPDAIVVERYWVGEAAAA